MKKLLILLTAVVLTSCSTEKVLHRAINKNGQKESIAYIVEKYPEYFKNNIINDTIHDTIPVSIPEYKYDTIINFDSTSVIENERFKLEIFKLKNGKLNTKIILKSDTIKVPYYKIINIPCPSCPDIDKLKIINDKKEIFIIYKYWSWFSWILIVLFVLYKIFLKRK